jgi:MSHA biogenesis protein MshM
MIKATLGLTREPFCRIDAPLLPQQTTAVDMIKIHAQHGSFSVIVGAPGVGKSAIRAHLEEWGKQRDTVVASFTQTMHSYRPILRQLAESLQLAAAANALEKELIKAAWHHAQAHKTLYTVIDEAHLLDIDILRKLRLLFERFPAKHNLVLLGHPELMQRLTLLSNEDIKSRISYSQLLLPLNDSDLADFITAELAAVGLGAHTFDEGALQVIACGLPRSHRTNRRSCTDLASNQPLCLMATSRNLA